MRQATGSKGDGRPLASVILAHPNPGSFNHAIAKVAAAELTRNGYRVAFHDLYAEAFDPVLPHDEIEKDAVPGSVIRRHSFS